MSGANIVLQKAPSPAMRPDSSSTNQTLACSIRGQAIHGPRNGSPGAIRRAGSEGVRRREAPNKRRLVQRSLRHFLSAGVVCSDQSLPRPTHDRTQIPAPEIDRNAPHRV